MWLSFTSFKRPATERSGPHGYDGAKKVSAIKRHLLVDTLVTELFQPGH